MPTYVYRFQDSDETIEVQQSFTDDALTEAVHPDTGEVRPVRKVFTPVGVTFKGSGFYKNDARGKSSSTSGTSSSSGNGESSSSSSSDSSTSSTSSTTKESTTSSSSSSATSGSNGSSGASSTPSSSS